jgi:hypothetical protein
MTDHIIAEVRDFPTLLAAMRARVAQLRTTYDSVDDAAFLAVGYTNRLLKRHPEKRMGPQTFGGLLLGLGCKLLLVQDDETFAKVQDKLRASRWPKKRLDKPDAHGKMPTRKLAQKRDNPRKGDSAWGRRMTDLRMVMLTPKFRQRQARGGERAVEGGTAATSVGGGAEDHGRCPGAALNSGHASVGTALSVRGAWRPRRA